MELSESHLFALSERITKETDRRKLGFNLGLQYHEIKVTKTDNQNEITIATHEML